MEGNADETPDFRLSTDGIDEETPDFRLSTDGIDEETPDFRLSMDGIDEETPDFRLSTEGTDEETPDFRSSSFIVSSSHHAPEQGANRTAMDIRVEFVSVFHSQTATAGYRNAGYKHLVLLKRRRYESAIA
jgi:hypothetical protein